MFVLTLYFLDFAPKHFDVYYFIGFISYKTN